MPAVALRYKSGDWPEQITRFGVDKEIIFCYYLQGTAVCQVTAATRSTIMTEASLPSSAGLLLVIRGLLPALNEQEQKVGQYVLDHPDEVIHLPMSDLAQRCAVSDTTVFRFCRKVRTDGYQDFKIRLALELTPGRLATNSMVHPGEGVGEAARKVITADIKALDDTLSVLDFSALQRAADALLGARRVDIYGSGGGAIAALELQYKLMRVGVRAAPLADAEMQLISAALLSPVDLAVAISHSGKSQDLLHALQVAKGTGAQTIAITNHPASPLARLADISLCTAAQEALAHGYPLGERVAQVGLIDMLYTCMARKRQAEVENSEGRITEALHGLQG
jgi:DNA-binding MurR/RpiR family transcriptional regulator